MHPQAHPAARAASAAPGARYCTSDNIALEASRFQVGDRVFTYVGLERRSGRITFVHALDCHRPYEVQIDPNPNHVVLRCASSLFRDACNDYEDQPEFDDYAHKTLSLARTLSASREHQRTTPPRARTAIGGAK